jgi:hypothetical protein
MTSVFLRRNRAGRYRSVSLGRGTCGFIHDWTTRTGPLLFRARAIEAMSRMRVLSCMEFLALGVVRIRSERVSSKHVDCGGVQNRAIVYLIPGSRLLWLGA